jgi:hypothetical protein
MTVEQVISLGFDRSFKDEDEGYIRVRCSQCEALVINGIPAHEHGCPNQVTKDIFQEDIFQED